MVAKEDNSGVFVSTTFEKPEQVRETFSQGVWNYCQAIRWWQIGWETTLHEFY